MIFLNASSLLWGSFFCYVSHLIELFMCMVGLINNKAVCFSGCHASFQSLINRVSAMKSFRLVGALVCLFLVAPLLLADSADLDPLAITLENQFGEKKTVAKDARFLVFVVDQKGSDTVKQTFEGQQQSYLDEHGIYVLADISGMPGIITKMFALPKLRTRPYSLMLDYDGELSKRLPNKEGHAAVMRLEDGKLSGPSFAADVTGLKALLPVMPEPEVSE